MTNMRYDADWRLIVVADVELASAELSTLALDIVLMIALDSWRKSMGKTLLKQTLFLVTSDN